MKPFPPLLAIAIVLLAVVGLFVGLYRLLTKGQRGTTREIRRAAAERGWRYRVRHWQGDPTVFRIDGRASSGLGWILKSADARGYDRGWTVTLEVRFPILGGEVDFAILPRDQEGPDLGLVARRAPSSAEARVGTFSSSLASGVAFFRNAQETPAGLAAFDAAYQVLTLPGKFQRPPVDPALAERLLQWPDGAMRPHSVMAWRDSFGLQCKVRLPGPPNWATISHLLAAAEDLSARVPPPAIPPDPPRFADRLLARIMGS